jgi:small conductance mechanosensitive channel
LNILAANTDRTVQQTTDVFDRIASNFFNAHSLVVLVLSVSVALLLGRFVAFLLRRSVGAISRQADKSENLQTVNRLRRYETYLILSIALIRTFLVVFAIYFWWMYVHPSGRPTAIIGASALAAILLSGMLGPILRDMAAGSYMMAEQWYGVGDFIKVEGVGDVEGVVERVTLRSTRVRTMRGEVVWVNNQNIAGIRLTPKGIRTMGLELFVDDPRAGERLLERANRRLPIGPLLVVTPITVISNEQVGDKLWHITALVETAPGREWLIEKSAVDLIKQLDENAKTSVIAHGPLFRYADRDAEKRFSRTIRNARKRPAPKRRVVKSAAKNVKVPRPRRK